MSPTPEEIIEHLDKGESPGVLVDVVGRRRFEYVRTSRPAYHFRIVRGPDEGAEPSFYRRTFREAVTKRLFVVESALNLTLEDMGYVKFPDDQDLKQVAARIAVHAVRNNTPLESLHGGISDEEMKALNISVTDNIYTMLRMFRSAGATERLLMGLELPRYWQEAKLNPALQHDKTADQHERYQRTLREGIREMDGALGGERRRD